MNSTEQTFATIPDTFIQAINHWIATYPSLERQCRCLNMSDQEYKMFFESPSLGESRYVGIGAPGGGWVNWFLCRHQEELYFVFASIDETHFTARRTTREEVDELLGRFYRTSTPSIPISQPSEDPEEDAEETNSGFTTPVRAVPTRLFDESPVSYYFSLSPPPLRRETSRSSNSFVTPQSERGVILFPEIPVEDEEEEDEEDEEDDEESDDGSEYVETNSSADEESDDNEIDSDDQEVVYDAWDNVLFEPRPRRQTTFYNPQEEQGLPGSGPGGDYYDRGFDPENRSKRRRKG